MVDWSDLASFGQGVAEGIGSAAAGTVKGVAALATDPAARDAAYAKAKDAVTAATAFGEDALADPAGTAAAVYRNAQNAVGAAYTAADRFAQTATPEQWGQVVGQGTFYAGTAVVGGEAADAAGIGEAAGGAGAADEAVVAADGAAVAVDEGAAAVGDAAAAAKATDAGARADAIPCSAPSAVASCPLAAANPGLGPDVAAESGFSTVARVAELKDAIPPAQQGRITMAVGLAEDANGAQQVLVGTSEPMGYLRPGVTLNPGEILARGQGHAEENIVNLAQQNGLNLLEVGATRPIYPSCASLIESAGATPVTPLKVP